MGWRKKLIVDTIKAAIPFQEPLRRLKRRFAPYGTDSENDPGLLKQGIKQIQMLRAAGVVIEGADVLEFGSGWNPLIPLLFRIAGARSVTLTDQERLLDDDLIDQAAAYLNAHIENVTSGLQVTEAQMAARLAKDSDRLASYSFRYLVPFDPATIPTSSIDIVVSRTVLEHVSVPLLRQFMAHFKRMLKSNAAMCHIIDMSDHWEHKDKSISRVNFLKYPEWLWRLTCLNPQNYQNRLRHSEFDSMIRTAGFRVIMSEPEVHQPSLEALKSMKLDRRFIDLPPEDLATITATILARS